MKVKTSITVTKDLLDQIDALTDDGLIGSLQNRSSFLETAAWEYIAKLQQAQRNARDLEIINRRADYLNAEVFDALEYQAPL